MKNRWLKFAWVIIVFAVAPLFVNAQQALTLEQALDIAEENNPALQSQRLSYDRARFQLEAQKLSLRTRFSLDLTAASYNKSRSFDNRVSEWYTNESFNTNGTFRAVQPILPTDATVTLTNTFGWQDNTSVNTAGISSINKAFSNNLNLRIDQPIFTYNSTKMSLNQIEFQFENAKISYALQRLRTEQNITTQFYEVYMSKNQLEVSRQELKNSQESYDNIKLRVDANLLKEEELFQAELNLATAQSSVQQRLVTLENAKDALKQSLGMSLHDDIDVNTEITVEAITIDQERAISYGLNSRMELRQREISMEEAELLMIRTKAQNEFSGNIQLSLGLTGDNKDFGNIYETPTTSPRAVLTFSVPIFDWGANRKRVNAQKAAQTIAKLEYDNQKINIESDVRQTCRRLENLRIQIDIANKRVQSAQRTYDLNEIRYRNGDITGMQMNLVQTQLSSAQISFWQTQIDYKNQLLNLKILSLYDFEKDEPLVPLSRIYDEE